MSEIRNTLGGKARWRSWLHAGWLGERWFRLELACSLLPTLVSFVLSSETPEIQSYLRLLAYTLLVGNCAALLPQLARRLYRRRKAPWDRVVFYLLVLVGIDIPDIIASFVSGMRAALSHPNQYALPSPNMLMFHLPPVFGELSPQDRLVAALLGVLTVSALHELELYEARHRELESQVQLGRVKEQSHEAELEQAHEIQRHLLPRDTPQIAGFQIACAWQPAKSVSGDYFDVFPLGEGRLALCIADVSGKGITAALLMANLQASVKAFARDATSPAQLCSKLNAVLCETVAPGKFVTLFYGIIDTQQRHLHYENAGHCLPLLVRADGSIVMPASYSGVLGIFSHWTFRDSELQLEPGDCLVMMTDGVLEAAKGDEEEFGYQRLIDAVAKSRATGANGIRNAIMEAVSAYCEGQFADDASLIVVTVD
jgi:sigma-B regulation protein RsbU (phosphoserine phosphatase)